MPHVDNEIFLSFSSIISLLIFSLIIYEIHAAISFVKEEVNELKLWADWKQKYGKVYVEREDTIRHKNFRKNLKVIAELNKKFNPTSYYGVNKFSDLTFEEFRDLVASQGFRRSLSHKGPVNRKPNPNIADSIDWRTKGAVSPIYDQGQCGSSPYFGAVASIEGAWKIAGHDLVPLSVQQVIDCSSNFGNAGCNGGWMNGSITYAAKYGLESNVTYPYAGVDGTCKYDATKVVAHVSKFIETDGSEAALIEALNIVPVATAVQVTNSFQNYQSGILNDPTCNNPEDISHGIAVVGYGADAKGNQYYILKNSWGEDWGMAGYILIAKNAGNMCGVATDACYAVV